MESQKKLQNRLGSSYLALSGTDFSERVERSLKIISDCTLCPRECHVDRTSGERGFCRTGDMPFVSSWGPHFGEERPLVGRYGSGTIFFGNCNLGCIFCQNYSISHLGEGTEIFHEKLSGIMISLQEAGCHNINLVTPTHQAHAIIKSVMIAAEKGFRIPLVYNCGGYESVETLKILDGIIDIYMPDLKYADKEYSGKYSDADDYPEKAKSAIKEMHRQVGDLKLDEAGTAVRGLLVRHLVLPEGSAGTEEVVRFIAEEISKNTYINIMDQYYPCFKAMGNPPLSRRITGKEYADAIKYAIREGLNRIDGVNV